MDNGGDMTRCYLIRGPLVLDGLRAGAMLDGQTLPLNERQFNALYLLAQREGKCSLTFEQLYESQWNLYDGTDNRKQACRELEDMIARLGAAGKGTVWIEETHWQAFAFRSK